MVVIKGCKSLGGGGRDTISVLIKHNGNNGQSWKKLTAHSFMVVVLSLMVLVQQGTAMDVVPAEGGVDSSIATSLVATHDGGGTAVVTGNYSTLGNVDECTTHGGGGAHVGGMFTDGPSTGGGGQCQRLWRRHQWFVPPLYCR